MFQLGRDRRVQFVTLSSSKVCLLSDWYAYASLHVLELVLEVGEAVGGRRQELLDGRHETVGGRGGVALGAVELEFLLHGAQSAAQLAHLLVQFSQTHLNSFPVRGANMHSASAPSDRLHKIRK